jgi:hypothetical protein
MNIIEQIKGLGLPLGKYAVFGSGPMAIYGIRESSDIDLVLTIDLYEELLQSGWKEEGNGAKRHVIKGDIEAFDNWDFGDYRPNVQELIINAEIVDGVSVISLNEVRVWKKAFGRPKDIVDVGLIDDYFRTHKTD